jgi:hypothetical protein
MRLCDLVEGLRGKAAAVRLFAVLDIDPALLGKPSGAVPRGVISMAMSAVLFDDLLARVPTGAAYVSDCRAQGRRVTFDHGALRTIHFAQPGPAALPNGEAAFTRIFEPLGYARAAVYPLDRLKMTGRAYRHTDFPETIPQFFLSELHVERFSPAFQQAAHRVFDSAADPLDDAAQRLLDALARDGAADPQTAVAGLPALIGAFGRQHAVPDLDDYRLLLAESAEAAWIATEGNAFNHATDRVPDVVATAGEQRRLGRPIKDAVEVSGSGRVRQTAFRADPVLRLFRGEAGLEEDSVPGSFYEFISRDALPGGGLDLDFDTANAQGIFAMTRAPQA